MRFAAQMLDLTTLKTRSDALAVREKALADGEAEWKTRTDFVEAMQKFLRGEGPAP
jgi:hypothetical protein